MRARTKFLVLGAASLIVAVLGVRLGLSDKEPMYDGHGLGYWFQELPITIIRPGMVMTVQTMNQLDRSYGSNRVQPSACFSAIQGIGTNTVPFLMQKLCRPSLPGLTRFNRFAFSAGIKRVLFADPEMERGQAVTALLALPSLPATALNQLRKVGSNTNSPIGASAAYVLQAQTETHLKELILTYQ